MLQIFFAFLAGILTVGAPCILPLLPILLGASVGRTSKTRPLFIAMGFIITFALLGLTLSYIVQRLMIAPDTLRNIAVIALGVFGILLIWPKPFEWLTTQLNPLINKAGQTANKAGSGNFGGFVLGVMLGAIWTPCAGPVLGSILTLIAQQQNLGEAGILITAYAIGAGIPMLLIAYGGQYVSTRVSFFTKYSVRLQQIFGVLILGLAVAMFYQYDLVIQSKILEKYNFPGLEEKLIKPMNNDKPLSNSIELETNKKPVVKLQNHGKAPEFSGIYKWLNSDPLTMEQLKGKVVLIDFWTYSCINCIRTLPYVTKWYDTYNKDGFVIVGVHTPEFAFEKVTENVETAIKRYKINYPVAQDNDFRTWGAYNNRYWPAHYLIDKEGVVRYIHFGEGKYVETENAIRQLLGLNLEADKDIETRKDIRTPEIYFGTSRLENLTKGQKSSRQPANYILPENLKLHEFALEGTWQFENEKTVLTTGPGKIVLKFYAGKVHMVAASPKTTTLKIIVDGKPQTAITVNMSDLYTLFNSEDYKEHTIEIQIPEAGFEAFTFTFG